MLPSIRSKINYIRQYPKFSRVIARKVHLEKFFLRQTYFKTNIQKQIWAYNSLYFVVSELL